ncbi:unnamed protein product [Ophioblennius macclurei]
MGSSTHVRGFVREHKPLILDGGLGTELEARGAELQGDPLWSARLLHTNPQVIRDVHDSFLLGGADVICTATYQASIPGLVQHLSLSAEGARELLASGVQLAKDAVKKFDCGSRCRPLVAGSVGPYGASLHDGSEYSGVYAEKMSVEELKLWHQPQVEILSAAGVDLIALETIPSLKEAEALVELLREFPNCEAWLSFSCKNARSISDGTPFANAVQTVCRSSQLLAVGVNCCPPAMVEPLLDAASSLKLPPGMGWVVYPNSGAAWDTKGGWQQSSRTSAWTPELSRTWRKQGAIMMGGCCCVGPADIAELRRHLKDDVTSCV